jgi:hypothetical protein
MKRMLLCALLVLPLAAQARVEPREGEEPLLPEPKITIVEDKARDATLQIHQVNGEVYGIRVIPKVGKPYNLVDVSGQGQFTPNAADRILIPEWVLKRF